MGEEAGESITPILFLRIAFLPLSSKQTKNRSCWRTPRTKTVSAVPADTLFLYLKRRTEENFRRLQDCNETLFPANPPDSSFQGKESRAVREPQYAPAHVGRMGCWGQSSRAHSGTPRPRSLCVMVPSPWKTPRVGILASLPGFFCKISSKRTSTVSHLRSVWLSSPCKGRAFPEVCDRFWKREFYPNKEARIWRKMNGEAVTRVNSCHYAANVAFQYKREWHLVQVPVSTKTTGDTFCRGKHHWKGGW